MYLQNSQINQSDFTAKSSEPRTFCHCTGLPGWNSCSLKETSCPRISSDKKESPIVQDWHIWVLTCTTSNLWNMWHDWDKESDCLLTLLIPSCQNDLWSCVLGLGASACQPRIRELQGILKRNIALALLACFKHKLAILNHALLEVW